MSTLSSRTRALHEAALGEQQRATEFVKPAAAELTAMTCATRRFPKKRKKTPFLLENDASHMSQVRRVLRLTLVDRARLAQSAERKALNLVVVGSSPTGGGVAVAGAALAQLVRA